MRHSIWFVSDVAIVQCRRNLAEKWCRRRREVRPGRHQMPNFRLVTAHNSSTAAPSSRSTFLLRFRRMVERPMVDRRTPATKRKGGATNSSILTAPVHKAFSCTRYVCPVRCLNGSSTVTMQRCMSSVVYSLPPGA